MMRLFVTALVLASVARGVQPRDRGPERATLQANAPTGIDRTQLVDNATVTVTRLHFAPGAAEERHTHAYPLLIVQLTDGAMTVKQGDLVKVSDRAGEVFFVPAEAPHAASTNARKAMDLIAVAIKPTRVPAPEAPPTPAPPGITRTTILDNETVRVVLVKFAPAGREPQHTHPNDLLTIQMSAGLVEIDHGDSGATSVLQPGFVNFLARGVPHAYVNVDTKPFELMSVAIK